MILAGLIVHLNGIGRCVVVIKIAASVKDLMHAYFQMGLSTLRSSLCIRIPFEALPVGGRGISTELFMCNVVQCSLNVSKRSCPQMHRCALLTQAATGLLVGKRTTVKQEATCKRTGTPSTCAQRKSLTKTPPLGTYLLQES